MRIGSVASLWLMAGFFFSAATQAAETITFAAAGDTMLGTDLRKGARGLAPGDGKDLLKPVWGIFKAADVAFLNLEGVFADELPQTKCGPKSKSCYSFRMPTRYVAALKHAGIDVVSNANNHAMDLGPAGMDLSLRTLDAAGIAHASRYGDEARLRVKGLTVAVLAAHSGSCCLNVNRIDEVVAAIRKADIEADLVVLSVHAGAEGYKARHVPGKLEMGYGEERGDVKKLARAAVDAGADLVLGHGPHVLRAMEVYKGRLIAYSLGNFMGYKQFGTRGGYGGTSVIVEAELAKDGALVSARLHPMFLDRLSVPHPDKKKRALKQIRELTRSDLPETGVKIKQNGRLQWSVKSQPESSPASKK
ncbi:MAG: CapA family protein [Deltaproteobacteria bacterium]|nr:CapA family protein [Deltaproteobacteria bacterium]